MFGSIGKTFKRLFSAVKTRTKVAVNEMKPIEMDNRKVEPDSDSSGPYKHQGAFGGKLKRRKRKEYNYAEFKDMHDAGYRARQQDGRRKRRLVLQACAKHNRNVDRSAREKRRIACGM
jgi:hypothetical protein